MTVDEVDNLIIFWNIATQEKVREFSYQNHINGVRDLELSPDEKLLAIATDETIDWLDPTFGRFVSILNIFLIKYFSIPFLAIITG